MTPIAPMARTALGRRLLLTGGIGLIASRNLLLPRPVLAAAAPADLVPFWGAHQAGIVTPQQKHTYFAAFDLQTGSQSELADLLRSWTLAAARMAQGEPAGKAGEEFKPVAHTATAAASSDYKDEDQQADPPNDGGRVDADTGEALGLSPAKLTITFGFGAGIFSSDGKDHFGLARHRPEALVDLPKFPGDQLVPAISGGDLSVQACADDPLVAFHAIRQLARIAGEVAAIRWVQTGFLPDTSSGQTPRNLMGFHDGTMNPDPHDEATLNKHIWAGAEGPAWMRGGSYMVNRRIRIALERWDRMKTSIQEQTVGRDKPNGAPLGAHKEFDPLPLGKTDKDGNLAIAENAHVRLSSPEANNGAQMLRRGYSYNDGVNSVAERWPPWHQGMEYDAGLIFVAYQKDVRAAFIPMFDKLSRNDMLNQFVTHVGGGLFACPGGVREGEYIGQRLLEAA